MSNRHEVYLISLALVLVSAIILYNVFNTPELDPAVIKTTAGVYTVSDDSDSNSNVSSNMSSASNHTTKSGSSGSTSKNAGSNKTSSGVVNINTATVEQLMTLDGVGEVRANAIVSYRNENGYFSAVDEIMNVSGIGEKTFEKIKNNITV